MSERNKFKLPILDSDGWLTPEEVARVLPNTSAKSVRDWCAAGKLVGAVQLPNRRWQIPWAAVVKVLGFDPRAGHDAALESRPGATEHRNDALPGLEEP
ncbi:MAG: helix-turn-helix domain-containing protein [Arachnia propionica]|uniref:helix-turn-helix domain-containing protein n=1 Tax=Arachnia propionica TaxID=1750 RepID=UPI0027104B84|nr:helix-turn-helix domain-containing protein [Arachnia propionica]